MMKKTILIGCLAFASGSMVKAGEVHWTYSGENGPENWATLSPEFNTCAGKNQAPINLKAFISAELEPIAISYQPGGNVIVNNGHTVLISYEPGSSISVDGIQFNLKQFHFHAPSENQINGKTYPMEGHLVHADSEGSLAVLTIMFDEGAENMPLDVLWGSMSDETGVTSALPLPFNVADLLPDNHAYYRFNGSLTTPPCSEGVRWLVFKDPVAVSREQVDAFSHVIHHPNNRPLQPIGARPVLQ